MRRLAALLVLGTAALLLTPGAPGTPDVLGDPTPPVVTPVITGTLGDLGWYRSNVTLNWSITDPESIILSTTGCNAITLTANTTGTPLTCTAESDGGITTVSKTFKIDKTAPTAAATPSRGADANGWYNHEVSVAFGATDGTSGVDSCSPGSSYEGPDTAGTTLSGTCRDRAGNTAPAAFSLKYDETPPAASGTARAPDANGWFNRAVTVSFQGTDATSGVDACTQVTYAGPDDPSVAVGGSCVDRAGNAGSSSVFFLKYDETPPQAAATASRLPDENGWYNRPLTVSFGGSDAMSGLELCDAPKLFSGPDAAGATISGSCRDLAGNVAPRSVVVKYDATAPAVTATPSRPANGNGWYNAPLSVSFAAADPISGVASCVGAKGYAGPDSGSASVAGSCTDHAGNTGGATLPLRYDATAPQATVSPARPPDDNGWYNDPLAVSFTGSDGLSGIASCDPGASYSAPDTAAASLAGTCLDRAGNRSAVASYPFKYDNTAPVVSAAPSRQPNATGWYTTPLSVAFSGGDATAGIRSCDPARAYAGPDAAAVSVGGSCTDQAGNTGSASAAFKYDATAPAATATPSRQPNANGWYNAPLSVAFAAADAVSGLDSCPTAQAYSGPESTLALVSGTCRDKAGNGGTASYVVRYDTTPPAATAVPRQHPQNGWFSGQLTVDFGGSDLTSGVDACTAPKSYAGPDTAAAVLTGSCSDRAGNRSADATFGFRYDGTAPLVTDAVPVRDPDRAGWYSRPIAFRVEGSDATSGLAGCPSITYGGPDAAAAPVEAACVDQAGNRGSRPLTVRYDATPPSVAAVPDRAPDANGWYNRPLTVGFVGEDAVSGLASCGGPEHYHGPDGRDIAIGGACIDQAGNVAHASFPLLYDATAPVVTAVEPARPPDANGWYNRPLAVAFRGSDATSTIDACTAATYGGPDAPRATVVGTCRDTAGNTSAPSVFDLRYDGTDPSLGGVRAKIGNGQVELTWSASPDTTRVEVRRADRLVYSGTGTSFTDRGLRNGVTYRYAVSAYDEAANSATSAVAATPTGPLVAPAAAAVVTRPPRLAWRAVRGATYYNVQLWRDGRILSAWPRGTSLQLRSSWTYRGRRYRLSKGRYRWYVWPGRGRPVERRFGVLLGSSTFVVR